MHSRVCQAPERFLRQFGALLILLALIGPLAIQRPAAIAQGDEAAGDLTELWTYESSDALFHDPAVTNGIVLVASEDSVVHAVDSETGEALWQTSTLYLTSGPYIQVGDGLLLTITDEPLSLNALDVSQDGAEERWSIELDSVPQSWQPTITEDGLVIVLFESDSGGDGRVAAFDSGDGSEQWSVDLTGFIYATGYLYSDDVVVVGTSEGIAGLDAASGDELWSTELDQPVAKLLAGDGAIFGAARGEDDLFAIDITTGDELWRVTAPTSFNIPFTYGDGLYFVEYPEEVDDEDVRAILALDAETGDERYTILSATGELRTGIVADGRFYLAADSSPNQEGGLEVYNLEDGALIARTELIAMGMAVDRDSIYVASFRTDQSLLYGYRLTQGDADNGDDNTPESDDDDTSPASNAGALDIAAMALTPWDLDDAGLENYGHGFSEMVFIEAFAAQIAANRDISEDDVLDELDAAGFVRAYYAYFYPPDDAATEQVVVSYVLEFADEDGASDAFEFLEDESDDGNADDLDGFDDLGDASEATLLTGEDPDTGDPFAQIDTTVVIENLHAGVAVVDWTGEEPDEDLVTDLIDFTLERVEDGFDADQPALSNQVVRLSGDSVSGYYDTYTLRDGEAIWFTGETADTADAQEDDAEDAGTIEEYRVWQHLATWGDDQADSLWSYISLIRFEDENAAEAWMADREGIVEGDEGFTDVEIEDAEYGDAAFTYTAVTADGAFTYRGITFQLGEFVATLDMSAPLEPSAEAIAALADEQLACLEDGGCLEPIKLPRAVEGFVADAEDSAGPEEDETPEAEETAEADETEEADGGPVLYESEEYDFTIAFDLNDWQFTPDEGPTDDGYEWLNFENGISTVWIAANPDYGSDELSDCVENFVAALGWEDAWELETLDELTDEDGRAFVSYTLNNSLLGLSAYLSVECRSIDDDASLMITHYADTDAEGEVPEDEVALVQELIDGIQITESTGEASDDETSASSGASYTSEEWGYTIAWDPEYWRRVGADQEEGIQLNYRFNTLASVRTSVSDADGGDPNACVQASIDRVNEGDGSDLVAADDLPAPELPNGAVGGLFLLGDSFVMYLECRPIVEGESSLRIVFTAPDENWEDILPDLENLLDGIQTPGDSGDSGEAGDAGSGDEADSAAAGESYTSEEWGYTVTWDPEYWAEAGASLDEGIRLGFQFNTLASVTIFAVEDDGGDPESCFEASIEDDGEGSELVAADDLPAPDLAEGAVGGVFMLGDFATMYFECRPLVEGESALRIAFGAPDENWEELLPYLEDILAGIEIPQDGD